MTPTQLVQSLFEAFGRGDIPFILERVSPDCRWVTPGRAIPYAGTYHGRDGAAQFFTRLAESEEFLAFEPREFIADGENVIALGYEKCRVRPTGKEASTDWSMLFRVRNGLVVEYRSWFDTEAYANAYTTA